MCFAIHWLARLMSATLKSLVLSSTASKVYMQMQAEPIVMKRTISKYDFVNFCKGLLFNLFPTYFPLKQKLLGELAYVI